MLPSCAPAENPSSSDATPSRSALPSCAPAEDPYTLAENPLCSPPILSRRIPYAPLLRSRGESPMLRNSFESVCFCGYKIFAASHGSTFSFAPD